MPDVFISYTREDREIAQRLTSALEDIHLSVFMDAESIVAGESFSRVVAEALSKAVAVIVLLSSHSKRSHWVEEEIEIALEKEKTVIPILLDSDAKNNWVWPLLVDRQAVVLDEKTDFNELARKIKKSIQSNHDLSPDSKKVSLKTNSKRLLRLMFVISLLLGGLTLVFWYKALKLPATETDSFIKIDTVTNQLPEKPDWKTTTVKTTDSQGNAVEVLLGVLWDPYRWVKADAHFVSLDLDEKVRYPIEDIIKAFQNDEKRPIIVVGTASHENAIENPEREIARAADRADNLVAVCGQHFINKPHIYSLNLGAYRPDKNPSTFSASERRVILLVIQEGESSPELTAEVKKILAKAKTEQNFIFDARDYSLFDTDRFQVVRRMNF
jgi:hypothetical protein